MTVRADADFQQRPVDLQSVTGRDDFSAPGEAVCLLQRQILNAGYSTGHTAARESPQQDPRAESA